MNSETLPRMELGEGSAYAQESLSAQQIQESQGDVRNANDIQTVAIASTFTVDPLLEPLRFWVATLEINADVALAPYGQVIQELLNPESLLSRNERGFNVLLIRIEDWIRDRMEDSLERNVEHIRQVASDFANAVGVLRRRSRVSLFILFCPSSSSLPLPHRQSIEDVRRSLMTQLTAAAHVHCWAHSDVVRLYPILKHEDPTGDRVAHIPYAHDYFVALATLFARRIAALVKPQYKVIAVDCDNTLWKGICAEDGADGVELTPAHLELQRMLVRQHDAGMLLCLCSKNNASDVEAVFKSHPEMPLREEHFVSSRVNWNSKSSNLLSLAQELDLSLDSFILVDDSPLECEEVRSHCSSVLTLQLPDNQEDIKHFLDHIWAFDRIGVTEEAKGRTAKYKQNRARNKALEEATDLAQFLASLELKVDVSPMKPDQLARVAELVQRTNQFNLTTIRRRSNEIEALWASGELRILTVQVQDRFGDYGLVGALFFRQDNSSMDVDTFVLSCRVLGRGVECRIINELGRIARQEKVADIVLRYRETARNAPARTFMERTFDQFWASLKSSGESAAEVTFAVPVEYAENVRGEYAPATIADEQSGSISRTSTATLTSSTHWHDAAYRLSRIADVVNEINRRISKGRRERDGYVAPRTSTERAVADIWAEVLGLEEVGVHDDFFDLGGDSLRAVQAITRAASVLGAELSVYEFFEEPTVEKVAAKLAGAPESVPSIEKADRSRPIPLSSAQQRLWFIDQLEGGSAAYHIPLAIRLRGKLDREALQAALDRLLARHEALRTVFYEMDGSPVQVIQGEARFALQFVDLGTRRPDEHEAEVLAQSREEIATPFDLRAGALIRGRLLQLAEDEHVLTITMHHIVSDGWSIGVLIRELGALYEASCAGRPDLLPPLPVQYADYAQWQRQAMGETTTKRQLTYWKEHLQDAPDLLELPTDRLRPAAQSYRGASVNMTLDQDLSTDLKVLSRRLNLTLAMIFYTAWSVLLSRLGNQDDIVIGMPVANRRRTEFEGLIGLLVNTLAVRVRLDDDPTASDLLQRVKDIMLGAYAHQDVPFDQVVEALQPVRSLSHSPVFQVMFVFQNTPRVAMRLAGLTLVEQEVRPLAAQFDLTLSLQESDDLISGSINYATDLFDQATIEKWVDCLMSILRALVREPHLPISRLVVMGEDQHRKVVELFSSVSEMPYPHEKLIPQLFEAQVERTPAAVAVSCKEQSLTFLELNTRADQLASYLRHRGVGPNQLVALCVERGLEMVIALLGILKAGGAYVPLDPNYPMDRLEFMLKDAAPSVLLTQARLRHRLPSRVAEVIALDADWNEMARHGARLDSRGPDLRSDHLAYVIYTSGSTGLPKGVMIEHRNVLNLWQGLESLYEQAGICRRVAMNASFSFDASVQQIVQLLSGRTVVIVPEEVRRDAAMLPSFIAKHCIDAIDCTPSQLKSWIDAGLLDDTAHGLRLVLVGGEPIDTDLWCRLAEYSAVVFFNVYGPTECTVDATAARLNSDTTVPHIGRPMGNRRAYILDRYGQPVPIGVAGELYIGGAGVGRGYFNRPDLTAERFLSDPFIDYPYGRMYRTGDLCRWRSDGNLEYAGRNDHQVKIRGYRIELGEIEIQLTRHKQLKEVVVIAREDSPGDKQLVAYIVSDPSSVAPSAEALRTHLKAALPEYMVPSAFVMLDRMPLTENGKLDRRALPAPERDAYASRNHEPAQGEVEEALAAIWQVLLRVERVGRHDNFFELGGHSLLIVQMMERLRRIGLAAELRDVFESPTLADLASALATDTVGERDIPPNLIPPDCDAITPSMLPLIELHPEHIDRITRWVPGGAANIQDIYPLVPLQEGILFHHLVDENRGDTYVLSTLLSVCSRARLEELITALQAVIDCHDILRTAVLWEGLPIAIQVVYRRATLPVKEITLDPKRDSLEQVKDWAMPERQRLDLRHAPLMRLQVAADPSNAQWYVLLQLHHMLIDQVTLETVTSEVVAHLMGRAETIPHSASYRNHVAQVVAYSRTGEAEAFFRAKLADVAQPTAPFGLTNVHEDGSQVEEAYRSLERELAQRVRTQARRLGVSAATLFHAAWGLVVAHTSSRNDVVFGTVLLGRLHKNAGEQRIVGMLINTLPLRLHLLGVTAKGLVEQAQAELVELFSHEKASLATAQRCSGIVGSAPLFTSLLNHRHSGQSADAQWSSATGIQLLATRQRTNYPMVISVDDVGDGFGLSAQTDRRIDPSRVTAYLGAAVQSLVEALERAPETSALSLSILPESERREVIKTFNAPPAVPYSQDQLIHQLFEAQVERTPQAFAVTCEGSSLTYAELNAKANQLASYLKERGVGPDELVALCVERGLEMVIALLGILKAGGAYVPLDPDYPAERLAYMLKDAAPRVLLLQKALKTKLPDTAAEVIALDDDWPAIAKRPTSNPDCGAAGLRPDHLAYVIYTSGSTGLPKGVMIEHRNVTRLFVATAAWFEFNRGDVWTLFHSFAFDFSVWELWGALGFGGRVVVVPRMTARSAQEFYRLLCAEGVTVLNQTPSAFAQLIDAQALSAENHSLRMVIFGGEALELRMLRPWVKRNGVRRPQLVNMYGITETTVHVTYRPLTSEEIESDPGSPIGKPIPDLQAYVLDRHKEPVPIGVTGELYVGGAGVARGYLNRPELTAERFVPDPFGAAPAARLYKTGDLGRWRADGTLEYLGRNDHQVKIRGFRIELGEIETQLARHKQVKEVIVIAREDTAGDRRLVAYVVPDPSGAAPRAEALRKHLKAVLPEYMVPSAFVMLERMPLTANGKLDRRALPAPDLGTFASRRYEVPQGDLEERLAHIWKTLLRVQRVGREDNFFDLGGHSLLALKALFEIDSSLGGGLTVTDIYRYPTVRDLAERIRGPAPDELFVDLSREAVLNEIGPIIGRCSATVEAVLLTGGTGFVGRFLLAQLLQDTDATIYCLVRASSQQQASLRLRTTLARWDLWRDEFESRIVAIAGDLRLPILGVGELTYQMLSRTIDSIYHCGTSMNHLETYAMAKPANVDSARELLKLATSYKPKLINYISTLSVFSASHFGIRVESETSSIDNERHSTSNGYAASKWVAEKIFMIASEKGIPCNIFRLGLVWADTHLGRFDELQNVYRVMKSCLLSGYGIKDYRYPMPPTPVDYVARAVVYLGNRYTDGKGVFSISSPRQMRAGVFERCNEIAGTSLELMSYYDWICEMKRLHIRGCSLPAVPLIEFAFSMDEESFYEHQRRMPSEANIHFELSRTHRELEHAGIIAPTVDDDLLRVCVTNMLSTDPELREWSDRRRHPSAMKLSGEARQRDSRELRG